MSNFYPAVAFVAAVSLGIVARSTLDVAVDIRSQTAALELIADELKPPLHSETIITKVDPGVCDTLGNALEANVKRGRK